jgi:hypothetical protein
MIIQLLIGIVLAIVGVAGMGVLMLSALTVVWTLVGRVPVSFPEPGRIGYAVATGIWATIALAFAGVFVVIAYTFASG